MEYNPLGNLTIHHAPGSWISRVPGKFWPYVSTYKYWILAGFAAIVLILFATKAETNSQQAIEKELSKQEEVLRRRTKIDPRKLGDRFYEGIKGGKGNKKKNYIGAIKYYEQCFDNNVDICMRLAKLFHNGLPESYNREGAKILGIPPSAEKSIFFYTKAAQLGNGEALLQMADIYHWGLLGFPTNKGYAKQLYMLLRNSGNEYQKGIAKDRLLQLKEEDGSVIGGGLSAASPGIGNSFANKYESYGQNPLDENFDPELDNPDPNVQQLSQQLGIRHIKNTKPTLEKFENNPHNVTDHVIDNTVKQIIAKLKPITPTLFQTQQTFTGIKRWILAQRCADDKKMDALSALQEIAKSLNKRSFEESLEIEALELVWNRIHSNVNSKNRNTLKQNMFNELAECIEYGKPVCRKGRITRIVDVLNGVDPMVSLKPKWALNEEMFREAAKLREDALKRAQPHVRDALLSPHPSPDQVQLCQKFGDRFKRDLVRDLYKTYVDNGLMSKELLKTELGKWINDV